MMVCMAPIRKLSESSLAGHASQRAAGTGGRLDAVHDRVRIDVHMAGARIQGVSPVGGRLSGSCGMRPIQLPSSIIVERGHAGNPWAVSPGTRCTVVLT